MAAKKAKKKAARKFSPESAQARDEGPRLIPIDPKPLDHTWGQYALELADVALGQKLSTTKRTGKTVRKGN